MCSASEANKSMSTAWYNFCMSEDAQKKEITVRVIRNGEPEPEDNDWATATMAERIEAVWTLTRLCMAWNNSSASEPEFQRTITRVQRARR